MSAPVRAGGLFSGIGGLERGVDVALGAVPAWLADLDPACRSVLERHYPQAHVLGDVQMIDYSALAPIDVLVGGPPCQPVSVNGRRRADADPRWMWPEFVRAIRESAPALVLYENPPGVLSTPLASGDMKEEGGRSDDDRGSLRGARGRDLGAGGRVFGTVLGDLAALGYDAVWTRVSVAEVSGCHRRQRIFLLAWARERVDVVAALLARRPRRAPVPVVAAAAHLLPTPQASDATAGRVTLSTVAALRAGRPPTRPSGAKASVSLREAVLALAGDEPFVLMPTPLASLGSGRGPVARRALYPRDARGRMRGPILDDALLAMEEEGRWDIYAPAVARWEAVLGEPAPAPLEGRHVSSEFVRWLMGFPPGWLDGMPSLAAKRALGNAVVPQQASLALDRLVPEVLAACAEAGIGVAA